MRTHYGLLACLILTLIAFSPALLHDGLPDGADAPLHYWKTVELEHIWSRGEILPRWAESFYYGYGAPTWQFTAAGPYALAVALGKLPLVDDVLRIKLVWGIALLLSTLGVYSYAVRRWGARAALVSAAAFTFAPAIIYIEPIGRASYPASFGLGCLAASLALLDSYTHHKRTTTGLLAVVCLAGLLLSHNVTAVMGAAVLLAWLVWQWLWNRRTVPYLPQAMVIFLLACGLTGFFWIPVAFERGAANIDTLLNDPSLDFHIHFQSLAALLKPAARYDANLWNQLDRWSLGIVTWPLALLGVVALFRAYRPREAIFRELVFWGLLAAVCIFLVIPQSVSLWENIELLATFQFPVRFLNIAALPLALLVGVAVYWVTPHENLSVRNGPAEAKNVRKSTQSPKSWRRFLLPLPKSLAINGEGLSRHIFSSSIYGGGGRQRRTEGVSSHTNRAPGESLGSRIRPHLWLVLLVAIVAQGLRTTPATWTAEYPTDAAPGDYIQHELDSGILGTTAANEFLPDAVVTIPPPTGFLIDSLAAGGSTQRINVATYPEDVTFTILEGSPTRYTFQVETPQQILVELYLFQYPGWQATLDGALTEMHRTGDFGFFGVYVPPGDHIVDITYPLTTPQCGGLILSGLAVLLIGAWSWYQHKNLFAGTGTAYCAPTASLTSAQMRHLLAAFALIGLGMVLLLREGIAWVKSPPGEALLASHRVEADFDGDARLLGYDLQKVQHDYWRVSLYWYFDPSLADDDSLNAFVHVVDSRGQILAQGDRFAVNGVTRQTGWRDDMHLRDTYHLFLPGDQPSGDLSLRVGLWRCAGGAPATDCADVQRLPVSVDGVPLDEPFLYLP